MTARRYLLAPERLLVGRGASDELPAIAAGFGRRPLLVADAGGRRAASGPIDALSERLPDAREIAFEGECTEAAIDRLAAAAGGRDLLVAAGGGKVLDAAKAAADRAGIPCVTLPTAAATCAAYTPLSIVHEADGAYVESRRLSRPIAAAIVDPERIVTAPPRLLAAGIVDALARAFDTILAARIGVPSETAALSLAVCRGSVDACLLPLADRALESNARGEVTTSFERVVEACVVGAGLAGETGARFFGRSFSHAVAYALSHVVDPDEVLHGEAAGLGILVHCALDPEPPLPLDEAIDRFRGWGVPTTFRAVGLPGVDGSDGETLAARTLDYLDLERAVPFPVEIGTLREAIRRIESVGPGGGG